MSMLFSEETLTLTETEVNNLFNQIRTLEIADSLNVNYIKELNSTINLYKKLELEQKLLIQDKDSLHIL